MHKFKDRLKLVVQTGLRWLWVANSRWGATVSLPVKGKLVVVVLAYQVERMKNVESLIRSALKCTFVEKVIVSNNNPQLHIRNWVKLTEPRLILLDQSVRRGAGYRWELIRRESADFCLAIDDDILLFPKQIARLTGHLIAQPTVPHGLAGETDSGYIQQQETAVNFLCQVYAVSRQLVQAYFDRVQAIRFLDPTAAEKVEFFGDDLVISSAGADLPLIHNIGVVLRCTTASQNGVAISTLPGFNAERVVIRRSLNATQPGQVAQA